MDWQYILRLHEAISGNSEFVLYLRLEIGGPMKWVRPICILFFLNLAPKTAMNLKGEAPKTKK